MSGIEPSDSIPIFKSFKPKKKETESRTLAALPQQPQSTRDLVQEDESQNPGEKYEPSRKKRRIRETDYRPRQSSSKDDLPRKDASTKGLEQPSISKSSVIPFVDSDYAPSYYVDTKGDVANVQYGRTHKYDIPIHRRTGYGKVLGVPGSLKITKDLSDEVQVVLMESRNLKPRPRLLVSKHLKVSDPPTLVSKHSIISGEDDAIAKNDNFIRFNRKKLNKRNAENEGYYSQQKPEGTSKDGSLEPELLPANLDDGTDSESSSSPESNEGDRLYQEAQRLNATLLQRTRAQPTDVSAWKELAKHQERMICWGKREVPGKLTGAEERTAADIKISIIEDGIRALRNEKDKVEELTLELLCVGLNTWDADKSESRWQKALAEFPSSVAVWTKYLDHIQTNFKTFTYSKCLKHFQNCLDILVHHRADANLQSEPVELEKILVYVVVRMTIMIFDTGYKELSIAIWQAFLELQIHRSTQSAQRSSEAYILEKFEEFWDSEAPRFGETSSVGWLNFEPDTDANLRPENLRITREIDEIDPIGSFGDKERHFGRVCRQPARTTDESDDDLQVVLYSDIKPFLLPLSHSIPQCLVLNGFLRFCGLPLLPCVAYEPQLTPHLDPFMVRNMSRGRKQAEADVDVAERDCAELSSSFVQTLRKLLSTPVQEVQYDIEELFKPNSFPKEDSYTLALVENCLHQIFFSGFHDDSLCEYLVSFKYAYYGAKAASKTAKQLLRTRPSSMRAYNALLLLHIRNNDRDNARKIFTVIQDMYDKGRQVDGMIYIWRTWAEHMIAESDHTAAKSLLLSLTKHVPETQRISAEPNEDSGSYATSKSLLENLLENSLKSGNMDSFVPTVECLVLLDYTFHGCNLEYALMTYARLDYILHENSFGHSSTQELLHQRKAIFLAKHIEQSRGHSTTIVRDELMQSLKSFPTNTAILAVFAANESIVRIDDRLRSRVRNILSNDDSASLSMWFFIISYEMQRSGAFGATTHSIRAAFERAVQSKIGRSCQDLWAIYVDFELRSMSQDVRTGHRRVREVFFRGLTHLPWCKEYMLLAFDITKKFLTQDDQKRILDVMAEKEIRTYTEIDEVLRLTQKK